MAHYLVRPTGERFAGTWSLDIIVGSSTVQTLNFADRAEALAEMGRLRTPPFVKQSVEYSQQQ
jgi:hypothetical protein